MSWTRWCLLIGSMALLTACTPPATDDDDDNNPIDTFDEIQNQIFTPSCAFTSCHGAANPSGGLPLGTAADSCNSMVDIASQQVSLDRVEPASSGQSYVYLKLIGDSSILNQPMPPPSGGLSQEKVDAIRTWIDAGAVCP